MKASELRSGNFIKLFKNGKPHLEWYELDSHDIYKLDESNCEDVEPIPLTEEWLLKFGFDNVRKNMLVCHNEYHNNRINEGAFYVEPVGDAFNHWYLYHKVKMITSNIRFVHQLQNLYFALCGEELELK